MPLSTEGMFTAVKNNIQKFLLFIFFSRVAKAIKFEETPPSKGVVNKYRYSVSCRSGICALFFTDIRLTENISVSVIHLQLISYTTAIGLLNLMSRLQSFGVTLEENYLPNLEMFVLCESHDRT